MTEEYVRRIMYVVENVARELKAPITRSDYYLEDMGCPHQQPSRLPAGSGAVYIFSYGDEILKIGKVNVNSSARFSSQHYGFNSRSTLAKSICKDKAFIAMGVTKDNVKSWMLQNIHRINIYIRDNRASTELVECIFHYAMRPKYEGNL